MSDKEFLERAIALAAENSKAGDNGPFGAVIVKNGEIIAEGWNQVVSSKDPTAHAEVVAIRRACDALNTNELSGAVLYSSCEPCPMCFSSAVWARVDRVVYAETRYGAAKAGFDDEVLYEAIADMKNQKLVPCEHMPMEEASKVFDSWISNENKIPY
ncbi:nucleoside deaminase [Pleionea sediminis]|uniref:nucleoside deaminase n=1 Tax=Pleionea sediminis TaxID=2569479 RepID=UPI00197C2C64|nr:nucleoside deaminase [Pleionea sediminis]